jgi:hypothetical protein
MNDVNKYLSELMKSGVDPSKTDIVLGKARQTGKSWSTASLMAWKHLYDNHERAQKRKESINKIFNI